MKICERGQGWIQLINEEGDVRACSWIGLEHSGIGNIIKDDISTILNGERSKKFQKPLLDKTYCNCDPQNCPWLVNGKIEEHLVEYEDNIEYPRELLLAYEGSCNYRCPCCTSYEHMIVQPGEDREKQYALIKEKLLPILPHVKKISANGRGEVFASPHIMEVLANWNPISPVEECSASLETNGSLFDEVHWKKIENLGKYNLSVSITIMSFDEGTYQFLSGCKYPISKIESNLRFVKKLREEGVINYLELATVLQEYNFREMPEFTRRCIEEFGADCVRIRPIVPGGPFPAEVQWFWDVRNSNHPYYSEYRRVMSHEIFKNPKVLLWSGDLESTYHKAPWENKYSAPQKEKKGVKWLIKQFCPPIIWKGLKVVKRLVK